MCSYYFIPCVVDQDEYGVCGRAQYDCGNAKTWEAFKMFSCPHYRSHKNECHYFSPTSGDECIEATCPRLKDVPSSIDLVTD